LEGLSLLYQPQGELGYALTTTAIYAKAVKPGQRNIAARMWS